MKRIHILQIVVFLVIVALGYILYVRIGVPAAQVSKRTTRYKAVKRQLETLRIAQACWRLAHPNYCSSFDSLAQFIETGSVPQTQDSGAAYIPVRRYLQGINQSLISTEDLGLLRVVENEHFLIEVGKTAEGTPWVEMSASNAQLLKDIPTDFIMQSNEEMESATGFAGLRMGFRYDSRPLQGNWEQ